MLRNIYVCFALVLLAACNANGLHSIKSTSVQHGASNGSMATDSKEKSACEAKGGYYSKTLGCFEQWCALVSSWADLNLFASIVYFCWIIMATVQLSTAKFIYAMASHKSNVATHVANDLIQINAFVGEQRYCELGCGYLWTSGLCGPSWEVGGGQKSRQ